MFCGSQAAKSFRSFAVAFCTSSLAVRLLLACALIYERIRVYSVRRISWLYSLAPWNYCPSLSLSNTSLVALSLSLSMVLACMCAWQLNFNTLFFVIKFQIFNVFKVDHIIFTNFGEIIWNQPNIYTNINKSIIILMLEEVMLVCELKFS